ncbi:hypothetical protein G6L30_17075 [Agrobacterium rhizogenes]|nr:hypothetical protein [Rhizobium rhizogenes]
MSDIVERLLDGIGSYGDMGRVSTSAGLIREAADKIEGLEADLDSAIEVAYRRGATEWVRLNYPIHYARLVDAGRAALADEGGSDKI